jgi:hypothetical protein
VTKEEQLFARPLEWPSVWVVLSLLVVLSVFSSGFFVIVRFLLG